MVVFGFFLINVPIVVMTVAATEQAKEMIRPIPILTEPCTSGLNRLYCFTKESTISFNTSSSIEAPEIPAIKATVKQAVDKADIQSKSFGFTKARPIAATAVMKPKSPNHFVSYLRV